MPLCPAHIARQVPGKSTANGETAPSPVITTRRFIKASSLNRHRIVIDSSLLSPLQRRVLYTTMRTAECGNGAGGDTADIDNTVDSSKTSNTVNADTVVAAASSNIDTTVIDTVDNANTTGDGQRNAPTVARCHHAFSRRRCWLRYNRWRL
jgi:ribonuclease HII